MGKMKLETCVWFRFLERSPGTVLSTLPVQCREGEVEFLLCMRSFTWVHGNM
jgi:hypothetical protein